MLYTFYKIVCKDENITDCYVGSTTNFNQRKRAHKSNCNNLNYTKYNQSNYTFIRNNGGWDNWEFIIIDTIECETKKEAHIKENEYMINLDATLNSCKAYSNINEYRTEYNNANKEKKSEYNKEYYDANKEKILKEKNEYSKEYYNANKEKRKECMKQYYNANKEKRLEYAKEYYNKKIKHSHTIIGFSQLPFCL